MTLLLPLALIIALAIGAVVYRMIQRRLSFVGCFIIAGLLGLEAAVLQTIVRAM